MNFNNSSELNSVRNSALGPGRSVLNSTGFKRGGNDSTDDSYFFKTIKSRGFLHKQTTEQLLKKAKIFDYEELCTKVETYMAHYVEAESPMTLATFIITYLLQNLR